MVQTLERYESPPSAPTLANLCPSGDVSLDWAEVLAVSGGGRKVAQRIRSRLNFSAQVSVQAKGLVDAANDRASLASKRRVTKTAIASWCFEEVLLGLDLTKAEQRKEWLNRTTFFDGAEPSVIFDEDNKSEQPTVTPLAEYRLQLDELIAIASRKLARVGLQGWVMSRVIEMALTGQPLEKETPEVA